MEKQNMQRTDVEEGGKKKTPIPTWWLDTAKKHLERPIDKTLETQKWKATSKMRII